MAWVEPSPIKGRYKLSFRWQGRKIRTTISARSRREADDLASRVEDNIRLVTRGRMKMPTGVDVVRFLLSDGSVSDPAGEVEEIRLGELAKNYLATHSNGAMELNSLETVRGHVREFLVSFGENRPVASIHLADIQRHVDRRAKKIYRGKPLTTTTLKKDLATFRAMWNWAVRMKLLTGPHPVRGVVFPKGDERSKFLTRDQIERRISQGGLSAVQIRDLWGCLFLTKLEVTEFLEFVRATAEPKFLHPLLYFVAHTGARRSEAARAELADLDLDTGLVVIREKKRDQKSRSFRRVPLSSSLTGVLREWLAVHPGGPHLFCQTWDEILTPVRRRTFMGEIHPLDGDELHLQFRKLVAGSRWEVMRGYHVLRHSFISACVAEGVDQRQLMSWVGHMNEATHRRYVHFAPNAETASLRRVFS
jgi:integrase